MAGLAVGNFQESLFQVWGLKPRAASEARPLPRRVRARNSIQCTSRGQARFRAINVMGCAGCPDYGQNVTQGQLQYRSELFCRDTDAGAHL
jgi:hypothetical protein